MTKRKNLRIPFAEAIAEPRLLKPRFAELSLPQQVALKVTYGCALSDKIVDDRGFSELDYWAMLQGACEYDELGYLNRVFPLTYVPRSFREAWGIWGVRSGKSDTYANTIVCYEAVLGGHEAYLRRGRPAVCFQIAQDLRLARYSLHTIKATLESMLFVTAPYSGGRERILNVTADSIELWNGIFITTTPPTVKAVRGYDAPCAVMDEVGVWYQDADSANPDFEIYRQVSSRQAQFRDPIICGISSPWNKAGLLHQRYEAGTAGTKLQCPICREVPRLGCTQCARLRRPHKNFLVLHGTTAGLGNPLITRAFLQEEYDKDPRAFEREYLAAFQDSLSGFLDSALVRDAIDGGVLERPPAPLVTYVAALDPAFKQDAFGFAIGHAEEGGRVVIDLARRWIPEKGRPLNPEVVLDAITTVLRQYHVITVKCDQYHFASLNQLCLQRGWALEEVPFTATRKAGMYGNLASLVNQRRIRIVDNGDLINELLRLEKRLTPDGLVRVGAPEGAHDDLASVVVLVADACAWLLPSTPPESEREPTIFERCMATVRKRRTEAGGDGDWV